jgi:thiamine phosphate synthase YjbQ (UPF0047 family)
MKIILSGEGNSDIGECDYQSKEFIPGPIAILTEKILNFCHQYEFEFLYKLRSELKRYPITLKGKKKKEKQDATGKGHSDLAYKLGYIAKEEEYDLAVLMRDAKKQDFQAVYDEIRSGFEAAKFERGVAAVPVPESEAWLICCFDPKESQRIEDSKEYMKTVLEQKLSEKHIENNKNTWAEIANLCMIEKIQAPSFRQFKTDLGQACKQTSFKSY